MLKDIFENTNKIKKIIKNYLGFYDEDLEQEVYIKIWKNREKYKEQNKFSSWVCTITANLCRDYLKSAKFKYDNLTTKDDDILNNVKYGKTPEKIMAAKERQKFILNEINRLPQKMKQALILYEFEDKSYEEISKKLNVPTGTVKSRINNARKLLSISLASLIGDSENE